MKKPPNKIHWNALVFVIFVMFGVTFSRVELFISALLLLLIKGVRNEFKTLIVETFGGFKKSYIENSFYFKIIPFFLTAYFGISIVSKIIFLNYIPSFKYFLDNLNDLFGNMNEYYAFFVIVLIAPLYEELYFRNYNFKIYNRLFAKLINTSTSCCTWL